MPGVELPEIQKFMPWWVCFGLLGLGLAAFLALLVVLASSARRPGDGEQD